MTLILPKHLSYPEKHPMWSYHTPNEFYENTALSMSYLMQSYKAIVDNFHKHYQISGQKLWWEVRIIQSKTAIELPSECNWWARPEFMDKVFWVMQKPMMFDMDGQNVPCYVLEYFECQRVKQIAADILGRNPFGGDHPSLLVPHDCVQNCRGETKTGYSEHLRHRPEVVLTAMEQDADAKLRENVDKILPQIREASLEATGKPGDF